MKKILSVILILFATISSSAQYYMNTFKNNGINYSFPLSEIDSLSFVPGVDGYNMGINKSGGEYYSIYVPDIDSITYGLTSLTKDPTVEINPSYVSLDWNKIVVVNQNPDNGFYQLKLPAGSPDIIPGTIFSADISGNYALNIVKSVTKIGDVTTIQTVPGSLCDVFANTNLVFTTSPQQATTARIQARSSKNTFVCTPIAIIDKDADGNTTYNSLLRTRAEITGTGELFKMNADYTNDVLWENDNCKLYFEKASFDWELDMVLSMSFGGRNLLKSIAEGTTQYFSKTLSVSSYLQGSCSTEQVLAFDVNGSYSYETENRLLKENIVERGFLFMAGEVPVLISLSADLCWDTQLNMEGEMHSHMGYKFNTECKAGFNWNQKNGIKPINEFSNNIDLVAPMVEGKGGIDSKSTIYPHIKLLLYTVVGPTFDIKPYLDYGVDGGFKSTYGGDVSDYAAWGIESNFGLDCNFGLSLAFADHEVANYSTNDINILKKLIYKTPVKVEYEKKNVKAKEANTLNFYIYDINGLLNKEVLTHLPQVLCFEGNGDLSKRFGIAVNGKVSVTWTPRSTDDILKATIYDADRKIIDQVIITVTDTPDDNDDDTPNDSFHEYVDLGLSVKWATHNVGASKPSDYGDYFAWGEVNIYNSFNTKQIQGYEFLYYDYKWRDEFILTKYNNSHSEGIVDNNTTLDLQDDAAFVSWGGNWRMPTMEEFQELIDNCTWTNDVMDGIHGYLVTSNISGYTNRSIFLPSDRGTDCSDGQYWSSTLYTDDPWEAWVLWYNLDSGGYYNLGIWSRSGGNVVRPVRP